jgi:hypothetical protein
MKLYLLTIGHRHGQGANAFLSWGDRHKHLADWARGYWEDRANKGADADHGKYSDEEVIDLYFEDATDEWYSFDEDEIPDPRIVIDIGEEEVFQVTADVPVQFVVHDHDIYEDNATFETQQAVVDQEKVSKTFSTPGEAT